MYLVFVSIGLVRLRDREEVNTQSFLEMGGVTATEGGESWTAWVRAYPVVSVEEASGAG